MGQIFGKNTATGLLQQTSNQQPLDSDEERQLEERFLCRGVDMARSNTQDDKEDEGESVEIPSKGQSEDTPRGGRRKKRTRSIDTNVQCCINALTESYEIRKEKYKAQLKNVESSSSDPYSINVCMEILEGMIDVSIDAYNKALPFLVQPEWRNVFVKMSDERRRTWLNSL